MTTDHWTPTHYSTSDGSGIRVLWTDNDQVLCENECGDIWLDAAVNWQDSPVEPRPMGLIQRDFLGGSEMIDLGTALGRHYFAFEVVQDEEVAEELMDRIAQEGVVTINEDQPEFIERYSLLNHTPEGEG